MRETNETSEKECTQVVKEWQDPDNEITQVMPRITMLELVNGPKEQR